MQGISKVQRRERPRQLSHFTPPRLPARLGCDRRCGWQALLALTTVLLSSGAAAAQGSYTTPGPTGGQVTGFHQNRDYSSTTSGYGGSCASPEPGATASGTISTVYTYQPEAAWDAAPEDVVVTQTCTAEFGDTGPGGSGGCDDGLGDPDVVTTPEPWLLDGESSGTHYTVQGGGTTVTVTDSPSASAEDAGSADVYVNYSCSVQPVTITLTGATLSADGTTWLVLAGQQVTATLNAPYPVQTGSYKWLTAAGDAFNNYIPTQASGVLVALQKPYTGPAFSFYTASGEPADVSCSATITPPTGPALQVNASIKLTSVASGASVDVDDDPPDGTTPGFTGTVQGQGDVWAMGDDETWQPIVISVPGPFTGGTGCVAQIISPSRTISCPTDTYIEKAPDPNNPNYWIPAPTSLDGTFPYGFGYTQVDPLIIAQSPYTWPADLPGYSGDFPLMEFNVQAIFGDASNWDYASANDQFATFFMYQPPSAGGQPTVWVAMAADEWGWEAQATLEGDGSWDAEPIGSGIPYVNSTGAFSTTTPPTWSASNAILAWLNTDFTGPLAP